MLPLAWRPLHPPPGYTQFASHLSGLSKKVANHPGWPIRLKSSQIFAGTDAGFELIYLKICCLSGSTFELTKDLVRNAGIRIIQLKASCQRGSTGWELLYLDLKFHSRERGPFHLFLLLSAQANQDGSPGKRGSAADFMQKISEGTT